MNRWFREFLIGKNASAILSDAEMKRLVLRGNLALVGLFVGIAYIFVDHSNGIYGHEAYYISCSAISLATLFLIRTGKYTLSALLYLSAMGLLIFFFSATDTYQTGVYVFFIASSLTSFALFGYRDRKLAILYAGISLILFAIAYWTDHAYLPIKPLDADYVKLSFTLNFVVALVTCMAIVYFLIDLNHYSEKQILDKNDQLAKGNAELDRFVYSASHDMRAPLSSILGLVQVYQLTNSEEEKTKVVELIRNRANKLDEFIREILDYSRNSRLAINPEQIFPLAIVKEVVEGLRYAQHFDLVRIEIAAGPEISVSSDKERLKVILNNLLGNAIKYHDRYKKQSVVNVSLSKSKQHWSLSIRDNGTGIGAEHQPKIFDMFYRANDNSEGSGLGLYIAQEAAHRLGGNITLKSTVGEGSEFLLEFPDELPSVRNE